MENKNLEQTSSIKYNPEDDCDELIISKDYNANNKDIEKYSNSDDEKESEDSDQERSNKFFYRNMTYLDSNSKNRKRCISTSAFNERSVGLKLRGIGDLFMTDHEPFNLIGLDKNRRKSMPIFTDSDNDEIDELNRRFEEQVHPSNYFHMSRYRQISLD